MKKELAINTKTYNFGSSRSVLVHDFCTGSCCLRLGLGCKITPSAELLSVLMEGAPREKGREGGEAGGQPRGIWVGMCQRFCSAEFCSAELGALNVSELSALPGETNPTKLGRSPAGTRARCCSIPLILGSQRWSWNHHSSSHCRIWAELSSWGIPLPLHVPSTESSALSFAAAEPGWWCLRGLIPCSGGCWQHPGSHWDPAWR